LFSAVHASVGHGRVAQYREGSRALRQSNRPNLRALLPRGRSSARTTITFMPIYEFECRPCGHRFEELIGSHVGLEAGEVACPECGSAELDRLISSSHAPVPKQMTPNQRRRLEDKRGTNRGGAKERFKQQRAAEKRAAAERRGSS
jgi:putative FmdB family regulatory protein